ncbi:MAG: histidine phosphatase family protein [Planctomycetota bacterium]
MSGQHTSHTDIPLTARGEKAAVGLGPRLRMIRFQHIFTSPRLRARRTCELAGLGAGAQMEPDLVEWNYGEFEGRRSVEILATHPDWNLFRDGSPGGESPAQVGARVDRFIARLRTLDGNVAIFSHGHLGRVLGVRWIGLPVAAAEHFLLDTVSVSILGHQHHRAESPAIVSWNLSTSNSE